MPADAILCTSCGFNRHTGLRREHKPIPCRECGYDLTGVTNPTCPECNTPIRRGRTSLLDSEREVVWASYRKALMGIGIGLASLVLFIGLMGSFRAVPAGVLGTLICWPAAKGGVTLNYVMELRSIEGIKRMVAAGIGAGFVSRFALGAGEGRACREGKLARRLVIVKRRDRVLSTAASEVERRLLGSVGKW